MVQFSYNNLFLHIGCVVISRAVSLHWLRDAAFIGQYQTEPSDVYHRLGNNTVCLLSPIKTYPTTPSAVLINLFHRLSHKSNSSRLKNSKNSGAVLSVVFTELIPIVQIAEASVLTGTSIDYPREDSAAHTTIASFWCQCSPSRFSL